MGIQNQSREAYRLTRHHLRNGILGKISKVYVWSFKTWGYDGQPFKEKSAKPDSLDWNLWLGTAPVHDYVSKVYHPGQWRKLIDFGCGTLGDMGIHIFDTPFKALDLKDPLWVEADCRAPNGFGHAEKNMVRYGFAPSKYTTDDFTFTWWDGKDAPRHKNNPDLILPNGDQLPKQGAVFRGRKRTHGSPPLFHANLLSGIGPQERFAKPDIQRSRPLHPVSSMPSRARTRPWPDSTTQVPWRSPSVSAWSPVSSPGKRLDWNAKKMKVTNLPEANPPARGEIPQVLIFGFSHPVSPKFKSMKIQAQFVWVAPVGHPALLLKSAGS